jgi:hypothetical protein
LERSISSTKNDDTETNIHRVSLRLPLAHSSLLDGGWSGQCSSGIASIP